MAHLLLRDSWMRVRHMLAWVVVSGCYLHHEVESDELPPGCGFEPTFYESLECPTEVYEAGEFAQVELTHRVGICCESGRVDVTVDGRRRDSTIDARWTACECNELLDCLGPRETSIVSIGPLLEGENRVRAGGLECIIVAQRSTCEAVPTSLIAPRVLFDDQLFSASVIHEATSDCLCAPRLSDDLSLRLCDCHDACDAVLTTYGGSRFDDAPLVAGEYTFDLAGRSHALSVRELEPPLSPGAGCRPLDATSLEFAMPADVHEGPRLIWAGVGGEQSLCCSPELLLAVRRMPAGPRAIDLQLYTCTFEDCLCGVAPPPTPGTAWFDLGDLPPGDYTIRAGDITRTLSVP